MKLAVGVLLIALAATLARIVADARRWAEWDDEDDVQPVDPRTVWGMGRTCRVCGRYKHQCENPTDYGRPVQRVPHEFTPNVLAAWRN